MKVTLRDIADHINVSTSTVSRALNDRHHVDQVTRNLVLRAAKELHYPLKNLRRPQKYQQSVLLLTRGTSLSTKLPSGVLRREDTLLLGTQNVLDKCTILTRSQRTFGDVAEIAHFFTDPTMSGLILLGGMIQPDFVRHLQETNIPFVVAGASVNSLEVNCVTADYANGIEQAVTHLVTQGRHRIGFINGPTITASSSEKLRGFRLALCLQNLPFSFNQVLESDFDAESGYVQTRKLLTQFPDLDAIIYAGDNMAVGGLHALKQLGKQVPHDVAVIGHYDHGIAPYTDPPLTSVQVDLQRIGSIAAERLLMLLEKPDDETWSIVIPTSLTRRDSA